MIKNIQPLADKFAISLSALCMVHCLALPLLIVLMPSIAAMQFDNEAFHVWMVVAVIPTSIYALTVGCKKHKRYQLLALGAVGLVCLVLALVLGEAWEKPLTVLGSCLIVIGHILNFRLCKQQEAKDACCEH